MFRRIIILFVFVGCGISIAMSYFFLKEEVKKHRDPLDAVPVNAALVLESQDIKSLWSRVSETNLVWSELIAIPEIQKLDKTIRGVDSLFSISENRMTILDNKSTVLSFHANGQAIDFFSAIVINDEQFEAFNDLIKSSVKKLENTASSGQEVYSFATEEGLFYYSYISPFLIYGSSLDVLDRSITQLKSKKSLFDNKVFHKLKETSSFSSVLHCFINFKELGRIAFPYLKKEVADKWHNGTVFPDWAAFDMSLKSDAFLFSGLSTSNSNNTFLKSVINQKPQQSNVQNNLPKDVTVLKRVALSNPKEFLQQNNAIYLEEFEEQCDCDPIESISSWLGDEILMMNHSHYQSGSIESVLLETNGVENVLSRMTNLGLGDSVLYNDHGVDIYAVTNNDILLLFGKEFELEGEVLFCQHEDFAIFSSKLGMNKILRQWRKEKAVVQQSNYSSFSNKFMANFSSSDYYMRCDKLMLSLESVLKREYYLKVSAYRDVIKNLGGISWQTSPSADDLQYHSIAINAMQSEGGSSNGLWSLKLKANVTRTPELMKNHRTNTLEVLIQDQENAIHLISATGKVKWSKRLEAPIVGEVQQIDVYANNKFQMLFNTSSKIHLIDINGNEVDGFPIELKSPATSPLTVLDYDRNNLYRILIACSDNKIYNYNQEGKIVEGWVKPVTESLVTNRIEHFVSEGKDYILFTDLTGKIYMVDRRGGARSNLNELVITNRSDLIEFEKGFSFSTSKIMYKDSARICRIKFDDTKECFKLDSLHDEYDLVIADLDNDNMKEYIVNYSNRVEVYGPDKSLLFFETFDFNLTRPVKVIGGRKKLLLIENNGEVHVYSNKLSPLPNSPIQGSVLSTMGDINKDGKSNIVTISSLNEVKVISLSDLEAL